MDTGPSSGWHILGAGAIGGLFAARLQAGGVPVRIVLRDRTACERFPAHGIRVADPTGTPAFASRPAILSVAELAPRSIARLLVATKAQHTADALRPLLHALCPDAVVVLLQNGMGVAEQLRPMLPATVVLLHALTTDGAWRSAPFELVHAGRGHTYIGGISGDAAIRTRSADIAAQWRRAGIDTTAEADIAPRLWRKLAVNCAINPFTALYRCSNGELPRHPHWLQRRDRVLDEIEQLAQRSGLGEALWDIAGEVDQVVAATAANRSSMFQDVLAQRPTEIDFLNGFIATRSARLGLLAPENAELASAVRALTVSH